MEDWLWFLLYRAGTTFCNIGEMGKEGEWRRRLADNRLCFFLICLKHGHQIVFVIFISVTGVEQFGEFFSSILRVLVSKVQVILLDIIVLIIMFNGRFEDAIGFQLIFIPFPILVLIMIKIVIIKIKQARLFIKSSEFISCLKLILLVLIVKLIVVRIIRSSKI
ncbi:hypothetical protein DSECCO2_490150 [anaerobic digester metagenome]